MIPLRLKAEAVGAEPFVCRLAMPGMPEAGEAQLLKHDGARGSFQLDDRDFTLDYPLSENVAGDVVFVNPTRGFAQRLIRAASRHNTLLITERCDQLCVMCSQPPKTHHFDMFPFFEKACLLAPSGATIGISGGEPTLFKDQLIAFLLSMAERRPDLRFHVLTNGQHFEEADVLALRSIGADRVIWGVPLYSAEPIEHDRIVGKPGAFQRLMRSLAYLCQAGANIELRTVLMTSTAPGLPRLSRLVAAQLPFISVWAIMQMENIGYARMNWAELFHDSSQDFGPVALALDTAHARGVRTILYNFPQCTVPPEYRQYAPSTISDWKRRYLDECEGCTAQDQCGGFFEWYRHETGFRGVAAL